MRKSNLFLATGLLVFVSLLVSGRISITIGSKQDIVIVRPESGAESTSSESDVQNSDQSDSSVSIHVDCKVIHSANAWVEYGPSFSCSFKGVDVSVVEVADKCSLYEMVLNSGYYERKTIAVYDLYILSPESAFDSFTDFQMYLNELRIYVGDNYSPPVTFVMGTEKFNQCDEPTNIFNM